MKYATITLFAAALAIAGCAKDPGREAAAALAGTGTGPGGISGDGGIAGGALGEISQSSIEFFNQEVGDRVLFPVDQSTLTPEAILTLDAQAAWLNANPSYTAVIEGHADEQGTRLYNIALGERRAAAVQSYLVSRGVAGSRLSTVSYGKERPIAICSDETCWSKNRRAVTVVAGGFGA